VSNMRWMRCRLYLATLTFDVNGNAIRVAKPGRTLEGAVRSLDGDNLVLGGPDETRLSIASA
jgi:hypothetical protein